MFNEPQAGNPFNRLAVIAACEKRIDLCKQLREQEWDKELAPYMRPHRKYWLFGPVVTRTREEALHCMDSFTYHLIEGVAEIPEYMATKILSAARALTTYTIVLTNIEFVCISQFYEKPETNNGWNYVKDKPNPEHGMPVLVSYMVGQNGPFVDTARRYFGPWEFAGKCHPSVEVYAWKEHETPAKYEVSAK